MRPVLTLLILSLVLGSSAAAQKKKTRKPTTRPRMVNPRPTEPLPAARSIGSAVVIVTKNGDQIKGTLLDLSAYSIRIKSGTLESAIALDGVASLSFGSSPVAAPRIDHPTAGASPDFAHDAEVALTAFQSMFNVTRAGTDYAEYGRLVSDLRGAAERFIEKHSSSENATAGRVVALLSGALTDYSWARTIWTLRLGRTSDGTVSESDSPIISDTLAIYPDLRQAGTAGGRIAGDKLTAGLWSKASEKIDRARSLLGPAR